MKYIKEEMTKKTSNSKLIAFMTLGVIAIIITSILGGSYIMLKNILFGHGDWKIGFIMLLSGITLSLGICGVYIISTMQDKLGVMVKSLTILIERENQRTPPLDPTNSNSSNFSVPGMDIKMSAYSIDQDGNIIPMDPDSFDKMKDDIFGDALTNFKLPKQFGGTFNLKDVFKKTEKKLEDMDEKELEEKRQKAIVDQDYELAAQIRDIIKEKEKK